MPSLLRWYGAANTECRLVARMAGPRSIGAMIRPGGNSASGETLEAGRPVPLALWILAPVLVICGVVYIARSNLAEAAEYGDHRTLADLQQRPKTAGRGAAGA